MTEGDGILILSLDSACGCDCVFCGLPLIRPHTTLSASALVAALEGAPNGGRWEEVNLTGGDPLVMPSARRLFPLILERRGSFERLSVSTAGVPAKAALTGLDALDQGDPLEVYVSLDGVGEVHDRVRRRPGAFVEATAFLEEARRRDHLSIALTCVINFHNVDHLDELADYAEANRWPISYAVVNDSDHYINSVSLYPRVELTVDQKSRAIDFLTRRSRQRLDSDLRAMLRGEQRQLPCRLLHKGALVTSDGAVSICGTSQAMILAERLPEDEAQARGAWGVALGRRSDLLARGASKTCQTCTTNCFAWRNSDGPVPT
jgi:MoaA/NifB/PqqE/SkfB family radical SAM enzyme